MAAQGVFSTLCVPVHGISVRALSRASSEISETRHAFFVWRRRCRNENPDRKDVVVCGTDR